MWRQILNIITYYTIKCFCKYIISMQKYPQMFFVYQYNFKPETLFNKTGPILDLLFDVSVITC